MRRRELALNKEKIIEGVKLILEGIGEDANGEGLIETEELPGCMKYFQA